MTAALKILFLLAGLGFRFAAHAADAPLAVVDGVAISSQKIEKNITRKIKRAIMGENLSLEFLYTPSRVSQVDSNAKRPRRKWLT